MNLKTLVSDFLVGRVTPGMPPTASLSDLPKIIEEVMGADLPLIAGVTSPSIALIYDYLKERIPHNDVESAGLSVSVAPSRSKSEDIRFLWTVRIAQNPLHIWTLMQNQQIAAFDVQTLIDLYPEIYEAGSIELVSQIIQKFTPEQQIPRSIKTMASIYLQMPVINAKTLTAYKSDASKSNQPSNVSLNLASQETK